MKQTHDPAPAPAWRVGRAWREMDYSTRFIVANRWSLILLPWFFTITSAFSVIVRASYWGPELWTGVIIAAASCTVGSIVFYTSTELRFEPHPHGDHWLKYGLVIHLITLGVSAAAIAFAPANWTLSAIVATLALYITTLTAFLPFGRRSALAVICFVAAGTVFTAIFYAPQIAFTVGTYSVVVATIVPMTKWSSRAMIETERARRLETQLSAAEERLRLSQDLHDTMGQHLAAMTIKTQLAQALAARNDPRVTDELTELHQLTQTAATDMRHVVNQYRTPDLTAELAVAKQVLTDAGAEVTITGTSADVPTHLRETAAWFVRETATNVLRHSQASQVAIEVTAAGISVTNNNPQPVERPGAGVEGLRRRAAEHGAFLSVEHTPETFVIELKVGA